MRYARTRVCSLFVSCLLLLFAVTANANALPGCDLPTFKSDPAAAVEACSTLLADNRLDSSQRAQALKIRGRSFHIQDFVDEAIRDFDEGRKLTPSDVELTVRRGWCAVDKRDYGYAAELASRAIAERPDYADGYQLLAVVKIWHQRDFAGAKKALDTAHRLDPDDGLQYLQRFWLYYKWGLYPEALTALDDALRAPDDKLDWQVGRLMRTIKMSCRAEFTIRRAWLFSEMGRFEDGIRAFDEFVQRSPGLISYSFRAANNFDRHRYEKAQADIDAGHAYDPDFWFLNQTQGQVYLAQRKYEKAIEVFTHVMTQVPPDGLMYWRRSMAWRGLNNSEEAVKDAFAAMMDLGFAADKLPKLVELGYFQPSSPEQGLSALRDALQACVLDERCW